jgi:hypothetical protein
LDWVAISEFTDTEPAQVTTMKMTMKLSPP